MRKEGTNAKQQHVKGLELNNPKENKSNMHLTSKLLGYATINLARGTPMDLILKS
jgi:hypothetical protein